ncbi:MAG: hypothetical protein LCH53_10365 [Bacteroidetes bacterium]|nr:hypothetical protein [Bacteroidota bacterium]
MRLANAGWLRRKTAVAAHAGRFRPLRQTLYLLPLGSLLSTCPQCRALGA